jgi:hypothetical protein
MIPLWLVAHAGAIVFLGNSGKDTATAPVCTTIAAARRADEEAGVPGCVERPQGMRVRIEAIASGSDAGNAIVRIGALDGSFGGYAPLDVLQPPIPHGVRVVLRPAPQANEHLTIAGSQHNDSDNGTDLGRSANAVVLRFDQNAYDERDLEVRIISGPHRGMKGWLYARQAYVDGAELDLLRLP